ncbi:hypothetical protein OTB20_36130 [Streptomyces sp. H27-H1]|uniref:hypothetical protein n=1 Tax=Streptomyces sp. H27-H1 TaxID=2996461 RepID=UPI00226F6C14|nr:hypothetical protein [Streptomyces sp. H27-H1]MCY0931521.1 hypothetical protein [Streptomyces sp. H27-H1]
MSLHPRWFFDQELALSLPGGTVIGESYYATPGPRSPLRLRVDFHPTIREREYRGLRVRILHEDKGTIDDVVLSFADHQTFQHRDQAAGSYPGLTGHGVFTDYNTAKGGPGWAGGDWTPLREAITRYSALWFPPKRSRSTVRSAVAPALQATPAKTATSPKR